MGILLIKKRDTTPRMRGLPLNDKAALNEGRYNPAYAGTTVENI